MYINMYVDMYASITFISAFLFSEQISSSASVGSWSLSF